MTSYTIRYHDLVCSASLSKEQAAAVLAFLREADGFTPQLMENDDGQPCDTTARFFILEFEGADGERQLYRDALPARSVFAAARELAAAGLRPTVMRCTITAGQAREIGRERPINAIRTWPKDMKEGSAVAVWGGPCPGKQVCCNVRHFRG